MASELILSDASTLSASILSSGFVDEPGLAPIKRQYVIPKDVWQQRHRERVQISADAADASAVSNAVSSGGGHRAANHEPTAVGAVQDVSVNADTSMKRKRGQNKGRSGEELGFHSGRGEGQLCRWVLAGTPSKCRFADKCRDSHDLAGFAASKPPDLGPSCPVFAIRGYCPAGVNCRWSGSHKSTESLASREPSEAAGLVPHEHEHEGRRRAVQESVNWLPPGLGGNLRRGKHPFSHPLCAVRAGGAGHGPVVPPRTSAQEWRPAFGMAGAAPGPAKGAKPTPTGVAEGEGGAGRPAKRGRPEGPLPTSATPNGSYGHVHSAADEDIHGGGEGAVVLERQRLMPGEKKALDLSRKIYIAPLTTVGNLPFRRVLVGLGAEVTCGEMALAENIVNGSASEWALLRRHPSEKCFGVQLAGHRPDVMARAAELIRDHCSLDFVDINSGCPLDDLCNRGCGAALMGKPGRARDCVMALDTILPCRVTYKMRTGLEREANARFAHKLIGRMRLWGAASAERVNSAASAWEARNAVVTTWGASGCEEGGAGGYTHPLAAVSVHGRTRQQRYSSYADWEYIRSCVRAGQAGTIQVSRAHLCESGYALASPGVRTMWGLSATPERHEEEGGGVGGGGAGGVRAPIDVECEVDESSIPWDAWADLGMGHGLSDVSLRPPSLPVLGNGDVMSWDEWERRQVESGCSTVLLGRGPLIKPWLATEIAEKRTWDISSSERLDILKSFVSYGLDHWGSDQAGVNRTRRFLLEWLSFLCRYIPVGLLERLPQRMNDRPLPYVGRDDLETLMASPMAEDWVKISEILLGPVPRDFVFVPKHKSNSFAAAGEGSGPSSDGAVRGGVSAAVLRAGREEEEGEGEG